VKQQKRTSEVASEIARHFIQLFSTFFFRRLQKQELSGIKKARKLGVFRLVGSVLRKCELQKLGATVSR